MLLENMIIQILRPKVLLPTMRTPQSSLLIIIILILILSIPRIRILLLVLLMMMMVKLRIDLQCA